MIRVLDGRLRGENESKGRLVAVASTTGVDASSTKRLVLVAFDFSYSVDKSAQSVQSLYPVEKLSLGMWTADALALTCRFCNQFSPWF